MNYGVNEMTDRKRVDWRNRTIYFANIIIYFSVALKYNVLISRKRTARMILMNFREAVESCRKP